MTKILHIPSGEYVKFVSKNEDKLVFDIEDSWFNNISITTLLVKLTHPSFNLNIKSYTTSYDSYKDRAESEFEVIEDA